MRRLLKKSFELYSILACAVVITPIITIATLLKGNYPFLFHFLLFLIGWIIWTWIEYHYHRFLLHPKTEGGKTGTSQTHQHHHRDPSQFETKWSHRILLLIFSCVFIYTAYWLNNYFTLFSGLFWGWTAFCYIHYLLHKKWTKPFIPRHHEFHIAHHCRYTDKCFGVSVIWWDILFDTFPEKNISLNARILCLYYKK